MGDVWAKVPKTVLFSSHIFLSILIQSSSSEGGGGCDILMRSETMTSVLINSEH